MIINTCFMTNYSVIVKRLERWSNYSPMAGPELVSSFCLQSWQYSVHSEILELPVIWCNLTSYDCILYLCHPGYYIGDNHNICWLFNLIHSLTQHTQCTHKYNRRVSKLNIPQIWQMYLQENKSTTAWLLIC